MEYQLGCGWFLISTVCVLVLTVLVHLCTDWSEPLAGNVSVFGGSALGAVILVLILAVHDLNVTRQQADDPGTDEPSAAAADHHVEESGPAG